MEIRRSIQATLIFLFFLVLIFSVRQHALAASGKIIAVPESGSFPSGSTLNVAIKVEGGGVAFNAAKATIALVPSATVQSIQIGDCGFAFIKTPTTLDPSFVGVILGESSVSCTAYIMRFQVLSPGLQEINITDASIKSFNGANEELNSVEDGNFSITQSSSVVSPIPTLPTESPSIDSKGNRLYSVLYSVSLPKNTSPKDVNVRLDLVGSPAKVVGSGEGLTAEFTNVPEGAHTLSVASSGKKINEQIVYLDGDNKNLAFGNKPKDSTFPILWVVLGVIIALVVLGIVSGLVFYRRRKNIIY